MSKGTIMLSEYRVLDLSNERGQLAGQMMAAFGAEVIAVEPPGGSTSRLIGPFADDEPGPDRSLFHWAYNRGKRSIEIDLTTDIGRDHFRALVRTADVLIESEDPGAMAALGLAPGQLAALNPALVQVSITPFGQSGPKADWLATDLTLAAAAGVASLTGNEDAPPLRCSLPQAYHHGAADAVGAVMIALYERDHHSGLGQHVDISAQQSFAVATQSFMLSGPANSSSATRVAGGVRLEGLDSKIQLLWPCQDGQVSVTFLFGTALGPFTQNMMNWIHEEGFCDEATRDKDWLTYANMLYDGTEPTSEYERVKQVVADFLITKTKAELYSASFERRVLIAPVATTEDVLHSAHWAARDFWQDVEVPGHAPVRFPGAFASFSETPLPNLAPAPTVGQHTEDILAELASRRPPPVTVHETSTTAESPRLPLEGLKVADFMWVFAGPYATRTLADYGAEVVRVESTHSLDVLRTSGNFQDNNTDPEWALQFSNMNAGKRDITLDLTKPEGRDIAIDLMKWSDVTVESFSPKAMIRWGLDYQSLRAIRPDLVMASSCLMGQVGPERLLAGFGTMAAAISGFFSITGWPDRDPCGPFMAYTDYVAPRFLVPSILAAVEHRRRTGQGQYIDLSQAEASMQFLAPALLELTVNGRVMDRKGNDDAIYAPHGCFPAAGDDAWIAIAVTTDEQWVTLASAMGREDLAFLNAETRRERSAWLGDVVSEWTVHQDPIVLTCLLQQLGVPAHQVTATSEAHRDPQLAHRGHFVEVPHSAMGTTWVEGSKFQLSRTPAKVETGGPLLGEHSWAVLSDVLGYDEDKIVELATAEILE